MNPPVLVSGSVVLVCGSVVLVLWFCSLGSGSVVLWFCGSGSVVLWFWFCGSVVCGSVVSPVQTWSILDLSSPDVSLSGL